MPPAALNDLSTHKRKPENRVFVNRSLRLEKIKYFGFDMDYTMAAYKSPATEELAFALGLDMLIARGYPEEVVRNFKYDPIFPVRGLWFDMLYGNLLKVDGFGNILQGMHGFNFLKTSEIEELYPNKFLQLSESRVFVLNTLFNLPETHLLAHVVDFFDHSDEYTLLPDKTGLQRNGSEEVMTYKSIFRDVRGAIDSVHAGTDMKNAIVNDLDKYVIRDGRIFTLLKQIRESGRKSFLLTNSEYAYTHSIMSYLLGSDWPQHFDIVVVDACKPRFFAEGTPFRQVNPINGTLKLGIHTGDLRKGAIYSGGWSKLSGELVLGSCDAFSKIVHVRGKEVLYVGDHIFGDVLRSKKTRGWRTFLVIPELEHELNVWTGRRPLFEQLNALDANLAEIYKNLDGTSTKKPEINHLLAEIRQISHSMDQEYGVLGSLFRVGSRTTFFASQVERYADLYAASCYNLVHYPSFYFFRAPMNLMPHESTVDHASVMHTRPRFERMDSVGDQVRKYAPVLPSERTMALEEEEEGSNSDSETKSARSDDGKTLLLKVNNNRGDREVSAFEDISERLDAVVMQPSHMDEASP